MGTVEQRKLSAERYAVTQRNYRRARERALTRLSQMYNEDYKELLAEEKLRDKKTNNAWISLSGSPSDRDNAIAHPHTEDRASTHTPGTQGYDGAET